MSILNSTIIILFCLLFNTFVCGLEMGIVSLNRLRLRHKVESGDRSAITISRLLEKPEKLFGTILVAININVIVATTITTILVKEHIINNENIVPLVSTAILFPLMVVFGELVPKTIARAHAERLVPIMLKPLRLIYLILFPIIFAATRISGLVARIIGGNQKQRSPFVTREELRLLVEEGLQDQKLQERGKEMIYRIFKLEGIYARDIMVPLIDVVAVSIDESIQKVIEVMRDSGYSRLPVYRERIDDITAIVQAADLIDPANREKKLEQLLRVPYIVPETKPIDDILREMQQRQNHMCLVVDEYGGIAGILTSEDIIEEIVGEIEDEYDRPPGDSITKSGQCVILEGKMPVDQFRKQFGPIMPKTSAESLSGMLTSITQHIPKEGEKISIEGVEFEILKATDRKVLKVKIKGLTKKFNSDTN